MTSKIERIPSPVKAALGAVILAGAGALGTHFIETPSQVNGIDLVDCSSGIKNGEMTVNLQNGKSLDLSGENGWQFVPHLILTSNNGSLEAQTSADKINIQPDGSIQNGNLKIIPGQGIVFQSDKINYLVTSSNQETGSTKVDIKASCTNK